MVQSLHDTGIIGLFFMLLIHVIPVIYALYAYGKTDSGIRRASLAGMALGAVVMFIASQASSFFWLGFPWLYLGILVAMSKDTIETAKNDSTHENNGNSAAMRKVLS
jgi:O-antigen ligase